MLEWLKKRLTRERPLPALDSMPVPGAAAREMDELCARIPQALWPPECRAHAVARQEMFTWPQQISNLGKAAQEQMLTQQTRWAGRFTRPDDCADYERSG